MALLKYCHKDFNLKKHPAVYEGIFKQAGKIRELQIRELTLKQYKLSETPGSYMQLLHAQITKRKWRYFGLLDKSLIKKIGNDKKDVVPYFKHLNEKKVEGFLNHKRKDITCIFDQESPQTEQIHQLRMKVKEYFYIRNIVPPEGKNLEKINEFQELLGKWHDNEVIIVDLKTVIDSGKLISIEKRNLQSVKSGIIAQNKTLFNQILVSCKDLKSNSDLFVK
jgi:CHAD domain-containing protein